MIPLLLTSLLFLQASATPLHHSLRSFGNENNPLVQQLANIPGCPGEICGRLAGAAGNALIAGSDECLQQDIADEFITAASTLPAEISQQMIDLAVAFRQAQRNTPPIFSVTPNINRNSVFCQKCPKSSLLVGLNQAQDADADPELFFDPKVKSNASTVVRGSQANTAPVTGCGEGGSDAENKTVGAEGAEETVAVPIMCG